MSTDNPSMAGPPPPLDSTPTRPPSADTLRRLAQWSDQQTDGLRPWLSLPMSQPAPLCRCAEHTDDRPEPYSVPEHRPMFGPPRPVDRWARLRLAQRAHRLAQEHAERRRWAAQVPRWTGRTEPTTSARALAVALDVFHPPRPPKLARWRTNVTGSGPCRLTVAQPTVAIVGLHPRPVADLDPMHPLAQVKQHPAVLAPSQSAWLTNDGRVTDAVSLDVDGNATDARGGRSKTSKRPSTVPNNARKTPRPVTVDGRQVRVWAWLDKRGQVQARTLSGHDVRLTARGRSALAGWLAPRSSETV